MDEARFFLAGLLIGGGIIAIFASRRYEDLYQRSMTAVDRLLSRNTCTWTFDNGQYIGSCDPDKFINISPHGMMFCPYCGRRLIIHESLTCPHCVDGAEHALEHEGKP